MAIVPVEPVRRISVTVVDGDVQRRLGDAAMERGARRRRARGQEEAIRTSQGGSRRSSTSPASPRSKYPQRSQFAVREISETVARVRVEEGRIGAVVHGQQGSKLTVEAKGTDAVAEADKGAFDLLADGKGQVAVAARTGTVRLSAKRQTVEVAAGSQSVVAGDAPPSAPVPIPTSLFLKVGEPMARLQRERSATIKGEASPGAVVSINGARIVAASDGSFSASVPLSEGTNSLLVEAEDATGRTEKVTTSITVKNTVSKVQSKTRWGTQASKKSKRP